MKIQKLFSLFILEIEPCFFSIWKSSSKQNNIVGTSTWMWAYLGLRLNRFALFYEWQHFGEVEDVKRALLFWKQQCVKSDLWHLFFTCSIGGNTWPTHQFFLPGGKVSAPCATWLFIHSPFQNTCHLCAIPSEASCLQTADLLIFFQPKEAERPGLSLMGTYLWASEGWCPGRVLA